MIINYRPRLDISMSPCYWPIEQLPGLDPQQQKQLRSCGILNTRQLLQKTHNAQAKVALASRLQIHPQYLHKWVALADLARLPSVGCQYCGLLLHAGIANVAQLAQMPISRLHRQILRLQVATLQSRDGSPPVELVGRWIQEARLVSTDNPR